MDAEYVKKNLDDLILIDARGEEEANKGTIKGATVIGWQNLASVEEGPPAMRNGAWCLNPQN